MRRLIFVFVALVSLSVIGVGAAMAQGPGPNSVPGPTGTFSSGFTVQNLGSGVASCVYQFYNGSGTNVYTSAAFTIPVGGSNFTYVPNIAGLGSGQYSGVVSCDQQVGAVVNSAAASSGGSYVGVDGSRVGTIWYAPNAFNNYYGFYTNFVVQNATASPVSVTVQIVNSSGSVVATQNNPSIPAYAYANFEQMGLAGLATNQAYSAKIIASGSVAVESNIYGSGATAAELYSYSPFSGGSTVAYAPVIMKGYYGYLTALTVQNLGSASTVVTVTYGTGVVRSQSVAGNASWVIYVPSDPSIPNGTLTSAKIESSGQPVVALVNEQNAYHRAASYTGFAAGSTTVRAPIVLKRYYNYNTSITCQNIGSGASTNITIAYSNGASSSVNNVVQNGTALFYQPNESGLSNGFNGSATISSSGGVPIVCVANEDMNEGAQATQSMDQLFAYEGLNQ
jgi:hypothetical protein